MIKFVSDSSCDRPQIEGIRIYQVPLTMSTDEKSFVDDESLNIHEMLNYLASFKGRSYTACPSVDAWMQAFEGGDEIYAVTITSGLSGSYNSAVAARALFLQSHPEVKIHIFDSLSTGPELVLLLEKLRDLISVGLPFEEVCSQAEEYQKHTRLFFSLQSVHNLAQNGRVNKVVAAAVGVLNIRIVGTASEKGTLETLAKSRGDRKAMKELVDQMTNAGYQGGKMIITHVENPDLAMQFAQAVRETWPTAQPTCASSGGLCSYYAERGALLIAIETE